RDIGAIQSFGCDIGAVQSCEHHFLDTWSKRKEIRYGSGTLTSDLADFPLLLDVAGDADIAAELSGGGGVIITAVDGTTSLPLGLYPSSDLTIGNLLLRFKTNLYKDLVEGDLIGYLYYDKSQSTTNDYSSVVSNGYALFMPLEEDPSGSAPQMFDW